MGGGGGGGKGRGRGGGGGGGNISKRFYSSNEVEFRKERAIEMF
jgi:hypothetical protein